MGGRWSRSRLLDETTFTYMVAVSSDPMPPHTFSGVFTYGLDKDTVNIGESSVTVEQPSTSVSRFKVLRYHRECDCWRRVGGENRHQWRIRGYRPGGGDAAGRFQLRIRVLGVWWMRMI